MARGWRGHVAGGHASPRRRPRRRHVASPHGRSRLYNRFSRLILPCGTMFLQKSSLAGDVDALRALDINHTA